MARLKEFPKEENRIKTNRALAEYLGLSEEYICRLKKSGKLYYYQVNGIFFYDKTNLFVEQNRSKRANK